MKGIGVLISGGGTNLQSLIEAIKERNLPAEIKVVISDREKAYGLERAVNHGIPAICINKKDYQDKSAFNLAIHDALKAYEVDIIVLAGFLSILTRELVEDYRNNIVNIHPSLIPAFCGMGYYGERVHQAVLDYGAKITGATVHLVDEGADTGPIILQESIEVLQTDDLHALSQKVLALEHKLLPKAVELLILEKIAVEGRKVIIHE